MVSYDFSLFAWLYFCLIGVETGHCLKIIDLRMNINSNISSMPVTNPFMFSLFFNCYITLTIYFWFSWLVQVHSNWSSFWSFMRGAGKAVEFNGKNFSILFWCFLCSPICWAPYWWERKISNQNFILFVLFLVCVIFLELAHLDINLLNQYLWYYTLNILAFAP